MDILQGIGQNLARHLAEPRAGDAGIATRTPEILAVSLKVGDVLLSTGNSRSNTAIKYLTQSSWSHACLYIGDLLDSPPRVKKRVC